MNYNYFDLVLFFYDQTLRKLYYALRLLANLSLFYHKGKIKVKEEINRHEILEKVIPLVENTAMRFNLIPIEIEFIKEKIQQK